MTVDAWVTIYAAIVATGALFLEVRRWFEGGPRIGVKATPNMTMVGGLEDVEGVLVVNAVNRGDAPTTINHFAILEFSSVWRRWRRKPNRSFMIVKPQPKGSPPIIPWVLEPGRQWTGLARPSTDLISDLQTGDFWAAIYTTDRDKPHLARIPKPKKSPELDNAKKVEGIA